MRQREQIMLCYPYDDNRLDKWFKEVRYIYVQPKYEGDRCRAVLDPKGRCTLFSSSARTINSVPHINRAVEALGLTSVEFDGELYKHGMPHEEIRSRVSRTTGPHPRYEEIEYHIYDLVQDVSQVSRLNQLHIILQDGPKDVLKEVPTHLASDPHEVEVLYEDILNLGYEGIVLRHPKEPYTRKRATHIMKLKPRLSGIYEVINQIQEYTIKGEPKNALGALILKDPEGNVFKVGSGFTHSQREDYWKLNLQGRFVKIRYQSCTVNNIPKMASFETFVQSPATETSL